MLLETSIRTAALVLLFAAPQALAEDASNPDTQEVRRMALPSLTSLDGTELPADTLKGKVVLFVNVASRCGYTRQYDGLQKLYEAKKSDGLVVVGVPCNQFGSQEPGSPQEIAKFCKMNYGVEFPLLEKQEVNGAKRSPLYAYLVGSDAGAGRDIGWNFEKFLVGRDGAVLKRWASGTGPSDADLVAQIDAALAAR